MLEKNNIENKNVQQTNNLTGQVNNQARNSGEIVNRPANLEQEMGEKLKALDAQRREREGQMTDITLKVIVDRVESKANDILQAMSEKGAKQQAVREIVMRESIHAAEGLLWCPEYVEKLGSEQHVSVYTGCHWEAIEPQQWKDFVSRCAVQCGVPESQRMDHRFMSQLSEGLAFNLAENRKQRIPDGEVWLNLCNGTLVVKVDGTVELREHSKEDLFTYTLGYVFDPTAECPLWHSFLDRVLPESESQLVLREFIDYCLMNDHRLEKMLLLYGGGLNGKSVTLEIIESLLGAMNVSYLSLSDLTTDEVKRAGIEGKKLNISHESGKDVNPNVLKQLTSGERVLIKHLYVDPRETNNYGKFIAAFNQLPKAENTFGFFRRLIILPYEVTIPKEEIDRQLTQKLKAEISGILNWVLEALPELMKRGEFTASEKCEKALDQYRLQSDNVRLFYSEMCEPSEYTTEASEIYKAYKSYCLDSSLKPVGKQKFYERLESLAGVPEMYGNMKRFKIKVNAE